MGRRRNGQLPTYRRHSSGQAVVSLPLGNKKYRDFLLGPYGSAESHQEYHRVIGEWLASGKLVPPRYLGRCHDLTISELCLYFWKHAEVYYRKPDGSSSEELSHFRYSLDPVEELYGSTSAVDFGPLALKAVRQRMIDGGRLCRKTINQRIEHVKRIFRWAVSDELIPSAVHEALRAVSTASQFCFTHQEIVCRHHKGGR